jgi:hypothetical protein
MQPKNQVPYISVLSTLDVTKYCSCDQVEKDERGM